MANIEKLEAVLGQIKAHPEQHNQREWAERNECGTSYCLAGWAVVLEGHEILWDEVAEGVYCALDENGNIDSIKRLAGRILDLSPYQRAQIFYRYNTVDDIELMTKNLANGNPIHADIPGRRFTF
jgi:hypothetical protein